MRFSFKTFSAGDFLGLGDVALKCFKVNKIYRGKFYFDGKLHAFKEVFGNIATLYSATVI